MKPDLDAEARGHEAELAKLRDWPEDFEDENGKYANKCALCGNFFLGYKRRVACKLCKAATVDQSAKAVRGVAHLRLRRGSGLSPRTKV